MRPCQSRAAPDSRGVPRSALGAASIRKRPPNCLMRSGGGYRRTSANRFAIAQPGAFVTQNPGRCALGPGGVRKRSNDSGQQVVSVYSLMTDESQGVDSGSQDRCADGEPVALVIRGPLFRRARWICKPTGNSRNRLARLPRAQSRSDRGAILAAHRAHATTCRHPRKTARVTHSNVSHAKTAWCLARFESAVSTTSALVSS